MAHGSSSKRPHSSHRGRSKTPRQESPPAYSSATQEPRAEPRSMRDAIVIAADEEGWRNRVVIGVVETANDVSQLKGEVFPTTWKFWPRPKTPNGSVKVTTAHGLKHAISKIGKRGHSEIFIIIHQDVRFISFNISSKVVKTVKVVQWSRDPSHSTWTIIDGESTFRDKKVDGWGRNDNTHKRRLFLGAKGLAIRTNPLSEGSNFSRSPSWAGEPPKELQSLQNAMPDKTDSESNHNWYEAWKGPAAAALGIAAGAGSLAFSLTAKASGAYFKLKTSLVALEMGGGTATLATTCSAVGGAFLLGAGVSLAVYFMPWDWFFGWLGWFLQKVNEALNKVAAALKRAWDWFTSWLIWFKDWVVTKLPTVRTHGRGLVYPN